MAALARQKQAETSLYVTLRDLERRIVEKALTYQTKLAEMAKQKGINAVVFDRKGRPFHGRIAALAKGARDGGLEF